MSLLINRDQVWTKHTETSGVPRLSIIEQRPVLVRKHGSIRRYVRIMAIAFMSLEVVVDEGGTHRNSVRF